MEREVEALHVNETQAHPVGVQTGPMQKTNEGPICALCDGGPLCICAWFQLNSLKLKLFINFINLIVILRVLRLTHAFSRSEVLGGTLSC